MENNRYEGNRANSNIQNMDMMIQWQGQAQDQGRVPYVHNGVWYPGTPNNMSAQDLGRVPYVHNGVWYPGTANNVSNLQENYSDYNPLPAMDMNMNGYTYSNPLHAMDMSMNDYNGAYIFNEPGTPYSGYYGYYDDYATNYIQNNHYYGYNGFCQLQQQPLVLQPQLPPRGLFNAGRGRNLGRNSNGRYSDALQAGGGRGGGLSSNNNNNRSSSRVMVNVTERLMRMRINEGERSTPLQDQVEGQEHAHAEAATGFITEYSHAKFFIIKSNSKGNVVSSMEHGVWTSTHGGNKILDAAYRETRQELEFCPVFLFFSVRGSGRFCGVAEMDGPVDFEASADCWDSEWKGKFPVKWHIIKDVPYNQFRHITSNSVERLQIIYSRDAEQVEFERGVEMLDIFNSYVAPLDYVSASSQQQSQSPSPHHQEEVEEEKLEKKGGEENGERESEQSCSGSSSCDTNADQTEHEPIENSPSEMQLKDIVSSEETQQIDVDNCMKPPKTLVDTEGTYQPCVENNCERPRTTGDNDARTQVSEDNTADTEQIMTPP